MKIQHKRSSALEAGKAKEPTAPQTEYGELCVNFNHQDPSLFIKDSSDVIRKIGGDLDLYLLKEDAAASVIIGESAPTQRPNGEPLESGDLWYCSSTDAEGGGRLYVYYIDTDSSQWVDTSLPGAGSDFGQTEAEGLFLKLDASNDPVTGNCEFANGVSVTGGDVNVGNGNLMIYSVNGATQTKHSFRAGFSDNEFMYAAFYETSNKGDHIGYLSGGNTTETSNGEIKGFEASADLGAINGTTRACGYYSNLPNNGTTNYNFYAAGTAPNYFAGLTEHAGGVKVTGGNEHISASGFNGIAIDSNDFMYIISDPDKSKAINFRVNDKNQAAVNSLGRFVNNLNAKIPDELCLGFQTTGNIGIGQGTEEIVGYRSYFGIENDYGDTGVPNTIDGSGYFATTDAGKSSFSDAARASNRLKTYASFRSSGITDAALETYAFYADTSATGNTNNYNFYAAGTAPNYFAGSLGLGVAVGTFNPTSFVLHTDGGVRMAGINGTGSTTPLYIASSGTLTTSSSDERLKTNINSLPSCTEIVKQLNPISFNWINTEEYGERVHLGFTAQNVQSVVPEAVGQGLNNYLSLDPHQLIPVLTKALQEVMQKNEDLEARLAALEGA